jgi:hypothetical protein
VHRELDELKAERDRRANEGSRATEKEREVLRGKVQEVE